MLVSVVLTRAVSSHVVLNVEIASQIDFYLGNNEFFDDFSINPTAVNNTQV